MFHHACQTFCLVDFFSTVTNSQKNNVSHGCAKRQEACIEQGGKRSEKRDQRICMVAKMLDLIVPNLECKKNFKTVKTSRTNAEILAGNAHDRWNILLKCV